MCAPNFKLLSHIKWNSINNCDCFQIHYFWQGRPLLLLAPGAKKPSQAIAFNVVATSHVIFMTYETLLT